MLMMLNAISKQKESALWKDNGGLFIPYPASWLNGKRWEDEVLPASDHKRDKKTVSAQNYTQREYTETVEDGIMEMMRLGGLLDGR